MVSIPASGGHYVILNPDVTLTKYSRSLVPGSLIPVNAGVTVMPPRCCYMGTCRLQLRSTDLSTELGTFYRCVDC